ncbi:MAG TPA: hypothetical protein VHE12_03865 [bacterium]|nr:hypothetical protein [bacterium]
MEFLKYLWLSFTSFFVASLIAIFRTEILSCFNLNSGQIPMSVLSYVLFGIGVFELGRKWDTFFSKTTKLKWFLNKKIKQGKRLCRKRKYESLVTRKIEVSPPVKLPNGDVLKEQMDYSQTDDFRIIYKKWTEQVFAGLRHGFGKSIETEFNDHIPPSALFNSIYDMRCDLLRDLEYLSKKRDSLKADMLDSNFNPKFLDDYVNLENL